MIRYSVGCRENPGNARVRSSIVFRICVGGVFGPFRVGSYIYIYNTPIETVPKNSTTLSHCCISVPASHERQLLDQLHPSCPLILYSADRLPLVVPLFHLKGELFRPSAPQITPHILGHSDADVATDPVSPSPCSPPLPSTAQPCIPRA